MSVTKTMCAAAAAVLLAAPAGAQVPGVDALAARAAMMADRVREIGVVLDVQFDQAERKREAEDRAREAEQRAREAEERARERELREYERAQEALERAEWAAAAERFKALAARDGARADAALYWQAYALDRLGQRAEALTAIAEMAKAHPNSRWLSDARALEIQVRQNVGQPVRPEATSDEDLKLLALNALQHTAPEQAIPMLQQVLQGTGSPKLKERALFVLAQSNSPEARKILSATARGGNPDLQRRAISYLGVHGSAENRAILADIYQASEDVDVKRGILRAYMVAGDRARVLAAATGEKQAELRGEAVKQLGVMGAHDELWQLYQKETTVDVKRQILQAMFIGGNAPRLIELARTEPNPELRRVAIRNLGIMSTRATGQALTEIYAAEKEPELRRAVIEGLFVQSNAEALVAIARKETDPTMKRRLIERLSLMKSKVAVDYLMEILGK